ncbi:hypothetical protein FRC00_003093 [Tulasnella sp. 408]|nr:hypothetical protein FRC00_003093 [Tulasnella sp. 408]
MAEKEETFSSSPSAIQFSFAKAPSFKSRSQQNQLDKPYSTIPTSGIFSFPRPTFSPAARVKPSSFRDEALPQQSSPLQQSTEFNLQVHLPAPAQTDTQYLSSPQFGTQRRIITPSFTSEKFEVPARPPRPPLTPGHGEQSRSSGIELPSPRLKTAPANSLSRSILSTPSTKERLLQRKRQSMGNRTMDSPMSPSPSIQPLPGSKISQGPPTHPIRNESQSNSNSVSSPEAPIPDAATADIRPKQEPPGSQHNYLAHDFNNSRAEVGSVRHRSLSRPSTEVQPGIGMAFDMIKSIEDDNVRLKAEVQQLSGRLESLQAEADGLSAKNKALEHKSQEVVRIAAEKSVVVLKDLLTGIDHPTSRLDANHKQLQTLKSEYVSQAAILEELKTSNSDVRNLREHVQASLADIRPLIEDSDETLGRSTVTRRIIGDIRSEMQTFKADSEKKQHVIDLLRERLVSCTGDLSEARDRVFALETELSKSRLTLEKTVDEVTTATSKISGLANELKAQQHETISALTRAGELQASLTTAESETQDLRHKLQDLEARNHTISTEYALLQQTHQQAMNEASRVPDLEARLQGLSATEAALRSKEEFIGDLQSRLSSVPAIEAEVKARDKTIAELRISLESAQANGKIDKTRIATLERAQSRLEPLTSENAELQKAAERSRVFESQLASIKKELENEKTTRLKAVRDAEVAGQQKSELEQALRTAQDMYIRDGQCITGILVLQISEQRRADQVEDLTTRIASYETQLTAARGSVSTCSSQVASLTASLTEIRLVVEKREAETVRLQDVIQSHVSANAEQVTVIAQLQAELKERTQSLKNAEGLQSDHQTHAANLERELRELGDRLAEATTKLQTSEAEVNSLKAEAQAPGQMEEIKRLNADLASLKQQAEAAEAKRVEQEEAFKTMVPRFRAREPLSELETSMIRDIILHVRAPYDKERLAQNNEIKGRDTMISKLQARNAQLEDLLEKSLNSPGAGKVSLENQTDERENVSQPLSTPMSDPPAPDADQVTTDCTPPSPPPVTRAIPEASNQGGTVVKQYGSNRSAAAMARHKFAELNRASFSSEDAIQGASSDDITHSKTPGLAARRVKRTHDDMEYDDEIEDDEENALPPKGGPSKTKATKSNRRSSAQTKYRGNCEHGTLKKSQKETTLAYWTGFPMF